MELANELLEQIKKGNIIGLKTKIVTYFKELRNGNFNDSKIPYFIHLLMNAIANVLNASPSLSDKEVDDLLAIVSLCYDATSKTSSVNNTELTRYLYIIIQNIIQLDHHAYALLLSVKLLEDLDHAFQTSDKKSLPKDIFSIIKNSYLLFWNAAVSIEKKQLENDFYIDALIFRFEALKYCIYCSDSNINKILEQATKAICAFQFHLKKFQNESKDMKILKHFEEINALLLKAMQNSNISSESDLLSSLLFLHQWTFKYISILEHYKCFSVIVDVYDQIDAISIDLQKKQYKNAHFVSTLVQMVKCCCQLKSSSYSKSTFKQLIEYSIFLDESDLKKNCEENVKLLQLATVLLKSCTVIITNKSILFLKNLAIHQVIQLMRMFLVFVDLLVLEQKKITSMDEKSKKGNYMACLTAIQDYLNLIFEAMKLVSDEDFVLSSEQIIQNISHYSEIMKDILLDANSKPMLSCLFAAGVLIGNAGILCYNRMRYKEGISFLILTFNFLQDLYLTDATLQENITEHLWGKCQLLVTCLRKEKRYIEALDTLEKYLNLHSKGIPNEFFDIWVKVKREAKNNSNLDLENRTLKRIKEHSTEDSFALLQQELKAYKHYKMDFFSIVCDMIDVATTPLQQATSFIELAQHQWLRYTEKQITVIDCCMKAINLLEEELGTIDSMDEKLIVNIKNQLAISFYWLYLGELQVTQIKSQEAMTENNIVPLERNNSQDSEDDAENSDVPIYYRFTIEQEVKSLTHLMKAIDIWNDLIKSEAIQFVNDAKQIIHYLKSSANIFTLAKQDMQAIHSLELTYHLASLMDEHVDKIIVSSKLSQKYCSLEKFEMSKTVLMQCAETVHLISCNESEDCFAYLIYQIAWARLHLHLNQIHQGIKLIDNIWYHPFLLKKTDSSELISAELSLVASEYTCLPMSFECSDENYTSWRNTNSIEHTLQAMYRVIAIAKLISNNTTCMVHNTPGFTHYIISFLMDIYVKLGRMYKAIGAPREARCYLKESLHMSHGFANAHRTAELLLVLAELDILSENLNDCEVKLFHICSILKYHHIPINGNKDIFYKNRITSNDHFNFFKNLLSFAEFIYHSGSCTCCCCVNISLFSVFINLLLLKSYLHACKDRTVDALNIAELVLILYEEKNIMHLDNSFLFNQESCIAVNNEFYISCALLQKSKLQFNQENYSSSLITVSKALKLLQNSRSFQSLHLQGELLWQKGLCLLNIWFQQQGELVTSIFDKYWNFVNYHLERDESSFQHIIEKFKTVHIQTELPTCSFSLESDDKIETSLLLTPPQTSSKTSVKSHSKLVKYTSCKAPIKKRNAKRLIKPAFFLEPDEEEDNKANEILNKTQKECELPQKNETGEVLLVNEQIMSAHVENENKTNNCNYKQGKSIKKDTIAKNQTLNKESKKQRNCKSNLKMDLNCEMSESTILGGEMKEKELQTIGKNKLIERDTSVFRRTTRSQKKIAKAKQQDTNTPEKSRTVESSPEMNISYSEISESIKGYEPLSPVEVLRTGRPMRRRNASLKCPNQANLKKEFKEEENENYSFMIENSDKLPIGLVNENKNSEQRITEEITINMITDALEEAFQIVQHNPPSPLYSNLSILLSLLKGRFHPDVPFYLTESAFVTLRHQAFINIGKKLRLSLKKLTIENENKGSDTKDQREHLENVVEKCIISRNALSFSSKWLNKFERFSDHLALLPSGWVICQISVIPEVLKPKKHHNRQLLIGRFQKGKLPLIVKSNHDSDCQDQGVKSLLKEFEDIQEANKESMKNYDKVVWWDTRRTLDRRMQIFLNDLENVWLGCCKLMLLGECTSNHTKTLINNTALEIAHTYNLNEICVNNLELLLNSAKYLTKQQLQDALLQMVLQPSQSSLVENLAHAIYKKSIVINAYDTTRQPVILILGKEIEKLPWESIPILNEHPVSRIPSLSLLHSHFLNQEINSNSILTNGIDTKQTYFILNPGNDLPNTHNLFYDWFTDKEKWPGVAGRNPTEEEFIHALCDHDLFIYCGHGAGSRYLPGDHVQRLDCRAVTLLMGCSSGKLRTNGSQLEPGGTVLQYLLAGCPSVVGALWDVTDRDIDRYLEYILQHWLKSETKDLTLTAVIPNARLICRLPFLIGAAPVTYGLPITVSQ